MARYRLHLWLLAALVGLPLAACAPAVAPPTPDAAPSPAPLAGAPGPPSGKLLLAELWVAVDGAGSLQLVPIARLRCTASIGIFTGQASP